MSWEDVLDVACAIVDAAVHVFVWCVALAWGVAVLLMLVREL